MPGGLCERRAALYGAAKQSLFLVWTKRCLQKDSSYGSRPSWPTEAEQKVGPASRSQRGSLPLSHGKSTRGKRVGLCGAYRPISSKTLGYSGVGRTQSQVQEQVTRLGSSSCHPRASCCHHQLPLPTTSPPFPLMAHRMSSLSAGPS